MTVRSGIQARLEEAGDRGSKAGRVSLPTSLKCDRINVRTAMFQRLASSRLFAYGDRSGVLRTAQKRSGRAFRLDVRQKVIVKALVSRHAGKGSARAAALAAHVSYLGRAGAGAEGAQAEFFDRAGMEDTKVATGHKDEPDDVAADGFEALMAGKDHVVAGSAKNRVMAAGSTVSPDRAAAAGMAKMAEPGSGT